jgi:hypothetical protein
VLLFIGRSGAGKSTLASNFHQVGQTALSDDCLQLMDSDDSVLAVPCYPGMRLWDDSLEQAMGMETHTTAMAHYSAKKRVLFPELSEEQVNKDYPVRAVITIANLDDSPNDDVTLNLLSKREAYIEVVRHSFQMDVNDLRTISGSLKALAGMLPKVRVYRLWMRHDYSLLPKIRQVIMENIIQADR